MDLFCKCKLKNLKGTLDTNDFNAEKGGKFCGEGKSATKADCVTWLETVC